MTFADGVWNPALVDPSIDSRAATFENPTGGRGSGGTVAGGRKGAPNRTVQSGERIVLMDAEGPGSVRHIWMTLPPAAPEVMRAVVLEVFYDGMTEPSISVPCLDFFGLPHGRPVPYQSLLMGAQEGRGFNSWLPMPFRDRIRIELVNASDRSMWFYYQVDYTLGDLPDQFGLLHVTFRRENPTTIRRDFVIVEGLAGPGRFLGCNVGVRTIDRGEWYGEGEVKIYRDGDSRWPTICGTGLEDYVGSAWGMGAHDGLYGGAPLNITPPDGSHHMPDLVGFYRWHVADPVMFGSELQVCIQQIGAMSFPPEDVGARDEYERTNPPAGSGWIEVELTPGQPSTWGIVERVDDYCATAYVYCVQAQPVSRVDLDAALADIAWREYENQRNER